SRSFCAEAAYRLKLRNARAHGAHDSPPAKIRAKSNRCLRGENNGPAKSAPIAGQFSRGQKLCAVQCSRDDPHCLLTIVAAMSNAICRCREQLQFSEPCVHSLRRFVAKQPHHGSHKNQCKDQTDYRRDRSEEHTSELQSLAYLVCRLLLEKKK